MNICVYCSSSHNVDEKYFAVARDLGKRLGERGDTLVWGGGKVGLMGAVAESCQQAGGKLYGVIPEIMTDIEIAYRDAEELIVTQTMRERKQLMDERADAFVILPGGLGTLEELAEILVLRILKYHDRPIYIVNVDGYYDPMLTFFEHMIEQKFAKDRYRSLYEVVTTVDEVMDRIKTLKL